jgi:hypothetical protein
MKSGKKSETNTNITAPGERRKVVARGNGMTLREMKQQGLNEHGQPVSSYWKARIEAEEGRVRVRELEDQLDLLRRHPLPVMGPTRRETELRGEVRGLLGEIHELEEQVRGAQQNLQVREEALLGEVHELKEELQRSRQGFRVREAALQETVYELEDQVRGAQQKLQGGDRELQGKIHELEEQVRGAQQGSPERERELQGKVHELGEQVRGAQHKFQEIHRKYQVQNQQLRKAIRELEKQRDVSRARVKAWKGSQRGTPKSAGGKGGVAPLGRYPSVRDLLEWMGIDLKENRVLAVGTEGITGISIEVRKEHLERVSNPTRGDSYVYHKLSLGAPAEQLPSIFVPYSHYNEYGTDEGVRALFQALGRPLALR